MLRAVFVRRSGQRDRVYVTRSDGSTTGWDFPSYGNLPHDLCHLVVEETLGLADGFWGLIDGGLDVGVIGNRVALLRDGRPLDDQGGERPGLNRAEEAVAAASGFSAVSENIDPVLAARLAEFRETWCSLGDGGSITATFDPP